MDPRTPVRRGHPLARLAPHGTPRVLRRPVGTLRVPTPLSLEVDANSQHFYVDITILVEFMSIFTDMATLRFLSNGEGCGDGTSPRMKTVKKYPGIHKKCSAHKCWLFAEDGRLPVEELKRYL